MSEGRNRPQPWSITPIPTFYMDYTSGKGVFEDGRAFKSKTTPGRKNPTLTDKLDTVAYLAGPSVQRIRIMLTGKVPAAETQGRHWLLVQTPGWIADRGHWLGTPPTGRFTHRNTGVYVEVRVASEWFGNSKLSPDQARQAWDLLDRVLAFTFGPQLSSGTRSTLLLSPAATGSNLWAASLPAGLDPVPITEDIAAELHATSGQHHQDHLVSGPSMAKHPDVVPLIDTRVVNEIPRFSYIDGRFMYASLCRELGTGPAIRLNRSDAVDLLRDYPYARARYEVKFTVPHDWHHVGIFGVQHPNPADGWYFPNRPGAKGITWADGAEVMVAQKNGWLVEPEQAIVFNQQMNQARKKFHAEDYVARRGTTSAKPLDLWSDKLMKARENIAFDPDIDEKLRQPVGAALRAILIQSIGSFASRGRGTTAVVYDPKDIPPDASEVQPKGKAWTYKIPQQLSGRQAQFYHPEFSAQIWGRGRAKVLRARANDPVPGALSLPGPSIIGINGDAIYTTDYPAWALPVEDGGIDDGKAGRLRLQGHLAGPMTPPRTRAERDRLKDRAQRAGTRMSPENMVDQSAFDLEFDTTVDSPEAYQEGDDS